MFYCKMSKFVHICLLLSTIVCPCVTVKRDFTFVDYLDLKGFEQFKEAPEIRVVYFYKREIQRVQSFYREYERSAELLRNYNVKCAVVDCSSTPQESFCGNKKVEHYVYAFRDGYELLQLELESMFDVNSIMSNILQLVLLRDVPIVQSRTELVDLENSIKGQHDLIFAYHRAIGTFEHRLYMDIAYAYQSKYKFAVTTEKMTVSFLPGFNEESEVFCMIWAFGCKNTPSSPESNTHCPAVKYTGKLEMVELASFVKALALPSVYHIPEDGMTSPYMDLSIHVLHLYHDNGGQDQAYAYAESLSATYRGMIGIITVNVDAPDLPVEYHLTGSLPAAILKLKNIDDNRYIHGEMDEVSLSNFVRDGLADFRGGIKKDSNSNDVEEGNSVDRYVDLIDAIERVESEDDAVSVAVHTLKNKELSLDNIPALTDKTFNPTLEQKDSLFVLFYLKVDAPSHAFLHTYADVGAKFNSPDDSPLARVECFDWTDVCQKNNITKYPTIHLYRKGREPIVYDGHLDETTFLNAIKLYQLKGITKLSSEENVTGFIDGLYPKDISQSAVTFVLGLLKDNQDIAAFEQTAQNFDGRLPFGLVTDLILAKKIASDHKTFPPCILVFKKNDELRPVEVYIKKINSTRLSRFISQASLPIFGELSAVNFPQMFRTFKPMVLLFLGNSTPDVKGAVSEVAVLEEFNWATFCWMNVAGVNNVGAKILYEYTKMPKVPHISLVNRHQSEVYNFPGKNISTESTIQWLRSIKNKSISPSMNLPRGTWRPKHEGFDFLRMLDEGVGERTHDDSGFENEVGLGFDEDGNEDVHALHSEEGVKLSNDVDEMYRDDPQDIPSSEEEVEKLSQSRLSGHHKRPVSQGTGTQNTGATSSAGTTDTAKPKHVTHDAGEF